MITVDIVKPADQKLGYFDELKIGQTYNIGTTKITRESALTFANIFDPFYFHIDEEAAKSSIFGGLIVSGLQTLSAIHALSIRGGFLDEQSIVCGAGIDELRFLQPVRPGDALTVTAKIAELKPPRRNSGHGIARLQYWVNNQESILVATFIDNHVVKSKENDAGLR
ncbi:MAG TPA: MaoC/PaaZ C-terminal domain-containing protein [Bradyrhizobium sp.]|nr:MaoC/PaaZ C-terminal domain-containing protein [Bradyrhizobium sp.]